MVNSKVNITEINLLPIENRHKKMDLSWISDRRFIWGTFAIILVALVLSLLYFHVTETIRDLENSVKQTKLAVEKERPLLDKIKEFDEKLKSIEQKGNALRSIQVSRKRWVILFEDLSTSIPPETWITGITQDANKIDINCRTWNFSEVALYMLRLEKKESITEISLTNINASKLNNEDVYDFSIKVGFNQNLGVESSF